MEPTLQQQLEVLHSGRACLVLASLERNRFNMVCMGEGRRILKYLAVVFLARSLRDRPQRSESCNDYHSASTSDNMSSSLDFKLKTTGSATCSPKLLDLGDR